MTKKKEGTIKKVNSRYVSINIKLGVIIIVALAAAVITFGLVSILENFVGRKVFSSEEIKSTSVSSAYSRLYDFIDEYDLSGKDTELLQVWLDDEKYTELTIYNDSGDLFSSGWAASADKRTVTDIIIKTDSMNAETSSVNIRKDLREKGVQPDVYNRIVTFSDGDYYVYINVYKENRWYNVMDIARIAIAVIVFFFIVILYNRATLKRMSFLSSEVQRISNGDLSHSLSPKAKDEIGILTVSIDNMRISLLEKMKNEEAAMNANKELITAMSHDIRTPLTSLIGYLNIIEGGKYDSEESLRKYIRSCSDKAFQLKGLSDKLFQYFLVFGEGNDERELESVDAGILFSQILLEHIAEIQGNGYTVNLNYEIPEGTMMQIDLSAIQRVFDNLFSNIMKYADYAFAVEIKARIIQDKIEIVLQNHIWDEAKKVESTKIGVKTCDHLCATMNGSFHAMEEERVYTTVMLFPIEVKTEEEIEETAASEDVANEEL